MKKFSNIVKIIPYVIILIMGFTLISLLLQQNRRETLLTAVAATAKGPEQTTAETKSIPSEEEFPTTELPATEPPVTEPPVTEPPATEPLVTEPLVTEPSATEPLVTEPLVTEPSATEHPVTLASETKEYRYILNTNTKKFHNPSCSAVIQIKEKNFATSNESKETLIDKGYSPCGRCKP